MGTGLLAGDEGLSAMTNMMNYDPLAMCETNRKVSLKSKEGTTCPHRARTGRGLLDKRPVRVRVRDELSTKRRGNV